MLYECGNDNLFNVHRVPKKEATKLLAIQILTDFQNSFTTENRMNISNKTA